MCTIFQQVLEVLTGEWIFFANTASWIAQYPMLPQQQQMHSLYCWSPAARSFDGKGGHQTSFIRGWGVLGFLGTHPPKTKPPTQTPPTLINI